MASAARASLALVLAVWLLLAASWGLIHGWIVPRIEEFRPRLETLAGKALGLTVRIGQISAQSTGLVPSFELQDVLLQDANGREALRLPKVVATLSPTSLWRLSFEQLVVDEPVLEVRRTADGRIVVGGLDVSQPESGDPTASNWFFSQPAFTIRGGTVRWTDERLAAPVLELTGVSLHMRNSGRRHQMRLDATPPAGWGENFSIVGLMRQPLLSRSPGRWQAWSGQIYADFKAIDIARLRQHIDVDGYGVRLTSGNGPVRAWADVKDGRITATTTDLAMRAVDVQLDRQLLPLTLDTLSGRIALQQVSGGFGMRTERLDFRTRDGLQWPGGNVALDYREASKDETRKFGLEGDRLDLQALAQIAATLPLGSATHALISSLAPRGLVEKIEASWQGPREAGGKPLAYALKGRVSGLAIAAMPEPAPPAGKRQPAPGRPGLSGATVAFDLTQAGGKASLNLAEGAIELPGIFEEPRVPFDRLSLEAQWKQAPGHTELEVRDLSFSNADAEGSAQVAWRSVGPNSTLKNTPTQNQSTVAAVRRGEEDALGWIDLQANLSRGRGAMVHRYLPLVLSENVRHYVRDAVVAGDLADVRFKVKGKVNQIPFATPSLGDFEVTAKLKNGVFNYAPAGILPTGTASWPALSGLAGELVFNRSSLQVNGASAAFTGLPGLQMVRADARIPDMMQTATLELSAGLRGPLASAIAFVNSSPLGSITSNVLEKASATGTAEYALALALPINSLAKSRVSGTVSLPGNDVQLVSSMPRLSGLKGVLVFTESGFEIPGAQARFLGGDIRLEGGMKSSVRDRSAGPENGGSIALRAQGTLTAEGLKQFSLNGQPPDFVSRLAQSATGSTSYAATLGFRRGATEISVSTDLQGMGLSLPVPLNKSTETALPIRFEQALVPASLLAGQRLQDQLSVTVGSVASVVYIRDIADPQPRVLRGAIGVGLEPGESTPLSETGVSANINLARVDLDEWDRLLSGPFGVTVAAQPLPDRSPAPGMAPAADSWTPNAVSEYLPNRMAVRARELVIEGRKLNQVVVGGTREGLNWRANIDAEELNGYLEFSQSRGAGAGRVFARLSRLSLGQSTASDVESLLAEQPSSIPSLDIIVDDLELRGRKLGRIEIVAVNRGAFAVSREGGTREWRLNKFNVTLPEAVLTASGNWATTAQGATVPTAAGPASAAPGQRRTVLNFKLDIADSGRLLSRFGMNDVIQRGKGKMEGQVAWVGSPLALDYPSMNGQFNVNIESGQFLKADPGIAKLLGVLSLQALPRRLTLDFRDVFSTGFAFDFVRGDVNIRQGIAATNNLQMKGVNAAVLMEGSADLAKETQDLQVVVVPEINAGTASLIATVINPAIGLGTFLAQYFLRQPLIKANTQEFHIDGTWTDPKITKVERSP